MTDRICDYDGCGKRATMLAFATYSRPGEPVNGHYPSMQFAACWGDHLATLMAEDVGRGGSSGQWVVTFALLWGVNK